MNNFKYLGIVTGQNIHKKNTLLSLEHGHLMEEICRLHRSHLQSSEKVSVDSTEYFTPLAPFQFTQLSTTEMDHAA